MARGELKLTQGHFGPRKLLLPVDDEDEVRALPLGLCRVL